MRFLYRFDVILALDQATHDYTPEMLETTPADQGMAAASVGAIERSQARMAPLWLWQSIAATCENA